MGMKCQSDELSAWEKKKLEFFGLQQLMQPQRTFYFHPIRRISKGIFKTCSTSAASVVRPPWYRRVNGTKKEPQTP